MDPHASDQSLQKTLPPLDPAAVNQLSSEVSAQANVLASHQLQLQHLTTLTERLVKALQSMQGTTPPVNPPAPAPLPASFTSSAQAVNPRLSLPERFDGTPDKCKGFLLQCSLFLDQQPSLYPTDISRVSFICSLLSGRALEWATAVWEGGILSFPPLNEFLRISSEVFEHSASGKEAGEELLALRQGKDTAADYSLTFRTLAAQTGWESGLLKLLYRKGLSAELQSELACRDEGRTLEEFINIAIRLDNLLRSRDLLDLLLLSPQPPLPSQNPNPCTSASPACHWKRGSAEFEIICASIVDNLDTCGLAVPLDRPPSLHFRWVPVLTLWWFPSL